MSYIQKLHINLLSVVLYWLLSPIQSESISKHTELLFDMLVSTRGQFHPYHSVTVNDLPAPATIKEFPSLVTMFQT